MSIYGTMWDILVPVEDWPHRRDVVVHDAIWRRDYLRVFGQAVGAWIGHPSGGPDAYPFLPANTCADPNSSELRAVVICGPRSFKVVQEYEYPLLVLSGTEYAECTWGDLLEEIHDALDAQRLVMPRKCELAGG